MVNWERLERVQAKVAAGGVGGAVRRMNWLCNQTEPVLAERMRGWSVGQSKLCHADVALRNNFLWNEYWMFKPPRPLVRWVKEVSGAGSAAVTRRMGEWQREGGFAFCSRVSRLLCFNAICAAGIALALVLVHLFHTWLRFNLYVANLLTIGVVTLWNFGMNGRFNWRPR